MSEPRVAAVADEAVQLLQNFKFRKSKTIDVLLLRIDTETKLVVKEQLFENVDLSQLAEELPSHEPRYILVTYHYEKSDGRVVYPYCMIFSTPEGCPPLLKMLYTASRSDVIEKSGVGKVFELRDVEDLSSEWLEEQLSKDT